MEDKLAELERLAGEILQTVSQCQLALAKFREAAKVGELRRLRPLIEAAHSSAKDLLQHLDTAQARWEIPTAQYIQTSKYADEITSLARSSKTAEILEVDGRLHSFPVITTLTTGGPFIKVGSRLVYGLRPRHVIRLLESLSLAAKARVSKVGQETLEALEKAYLQEAKGEEGVAIDLARIYDLFTLRPRQAQEYTYLDFLTEIYALDSHGPRATKAGRHLTLPASTSTRGGQGYRFVAENGEERLYSSIRFDTPQQ